MTIVFLSDFASAQGGAAKVAVESAAELSRRGHSVFLFAGTGEPGPAMAESGVSVEVGTGAPFNARPLREGALPGIWDREQATRFANFAGRLPKDTVVHVHSYRDVLSASVLGEAIRRFPTVYTCHDYALGCPYGCFYDFQRMRLCGQRGMSLGCLTLHCNQKTMAHKVWGVSRHVAQGRAGVPKGLAAVVCVSEFSRRILESYAQSTPVHVIPNPIDLPSVERELSGSSPFLFVGALVKGKGIEVAAQAAAKAGVPIEFVGDGEDRDLIAAANPSAVLHGRLDRAEVIETMRRARALVFPVLWLETQGMVVAESMAIGVPCIVTEHSAATEMVDQANGLLVRAGDVDDLAEAMRRLTDEAYNRELGEFAHAAYWADPPTLAKHIDRLEALYASVARSER